VKLCLQVLKHPNVRPLAKEQQVTSFPTCSSTPHFKAPDLVVFLSESPHFLGNTSKMIGSGQDKPPFLEIPIIGPVPDRDRQTVGPGISGTERNMATHTKLPNPNPPDGRSPDSGQKGTDTQAEIIPFLLILGIPSHWSPPSFCLYINSACLVPTRPLPPCVHLPTSYRIGYRSAPYTFG